MNFLSKLISPAVGLNILKKEIEKQLNKKINAFSMFYIYKKDKLLFLVEKKEYTFDADSIKTVIKSYATHLRSEFDAVQINHSSNSTDIILYYTETNIKKSLKSKL